MPDIFNLPLEEDIISRLDLVAPDPPSADLLSQVGPVLAAVLAEFQSPPGPNFEGGTGRSFVPLTTTRSYDGSGTNIQRVDDIVPGTPIAVNVFSLSITDIILCDNGYGLGNNTLVRPTYQYPMAVYNQFQGLRRIFPSGINNVAVTATFGFAASAPNDVYEAILSETLSRLLIMGWVGIAGAGISISMVDFSVNTSAGVSIWPQSSPIAIFHKLFTNALDRYRDTRQLTPAPARTLRRMY